MKSAFLGGITAGTVFGLFLGYLIGEAKARAVRAWRDFKNAKDSIKTFFRLFTSETWRAFRAGLLVAVVLLAAAWLVISNYL